MKQVWIFGIVLLSLVAMVSAVMIEDSAITRLKATYKGGDILMNGDIKGGLLPNTGTVNAFCKHNDVIDSLGSVDYKLSNTFKGKRDTFFIRDSSICLKNDIAWVEIGDYKSKEVIIASKKHHKNNPPIIILTDEELCELDTSKEWIENECVDKEVPLCYEEVCEQVQTTCNSYNTYESCETLQGDCNIWNYEQVCEDEWNWIWYKNYPPNQLCTNPHHHNCYRWLVHTQECHNEQTTCNSYNFYESCETLQGDCNIWNYDTVCEQVEVGCEV